MKQATITALTAAIAEAQATEPGFRMTVENDHILAGFWFETAVGRTYVCGRGETFDEALAKAEKNRDDKIAQAVVEAEVRAEVEARMAKAA